ncbi:MAG: MaoC family dehydratase [Actinomycetota bacterium]|nr:MaoC family dehydratase [Actinomycetota bacterium]
MTGEVKLRSLPIDQLEVGQAIERTRTVTAEHIRSFAVISGDFNPIHIDAEYAASTPFGRPIAHGPIILALTAGIVGMEMPGIGSIGISNSCRFLAPVYAGDAITYRVEILTIDSERRRVELGFTWKNQDDVLVADGGAVVMPPKKAVPLDGISAPSLKE